LAKGIQAECQMDLAGADWKALPDLMRFARAVTKKGKTQILPAWTTPSRPSRPEFFQGNRSARPPAFQERPSRWEDRGRPREAVNVLESRRGREQRSPAAHRDQRQRPAPRQERGRGYGMRVDDRGRVSVGPSDPSDRRWCIRCRGLAEMAGAAEGHRIRDCPWNGLPDREYFERIKGLKQHIQE
jgi:hypothetical protein